MKKFLWHYKRARRDGYGSLFLWRSFLHFTRISSFISFDRKGVRLYCHRDPFSFWLWNHKDELRDDELFLERFLREGDTVIDVGANIGLLTLRAAKIVGSGGNVHAVEPHPETYTWLQKNIIKNGYNNIATYNTVIGDEEKKVSFTNFAIKDVNKVSDREGTIMLPMTTLDMLFPNVWRCMLLKIDVEGYELQALFGAEKLIHKTDVIMFESSPKNFNLQGYQLQHILKYLELQGFSVYTVAKDFSIARIPLGYETKVKYENLFAAKDIFFLQKRLSA